MNYICLAVASLTLTTVGCLAGQSGARGSWSPIPDNVWSSMQGKSWHSDFGCPDRDELAYLQIPIVDFEGRPRTGAMIAARSVADDLLNVFAKLHAAGFPIDRMEPVYRYDGSDDRSMDANNTSAFNCRLTTSGTRLSEHSYGKAVDINPVQNPYVKSDTTLPPAGRDYDSDQERAADRPGMIRGGDVVVRAFDAVGWSWGGDWTSAKDYQHFSLSGN